MGSGSWKWPPKTPASSSYLPSSDVTSCATKRSTPFQSGALGRGLNVAGWEERSRWRTTLERFPPPRTFHFSAVRRSRRISL